jgi:hypothetical protein
LGGRDEKDHSSSPAQAKKIFETHLNGKKLSMEEHNCHSSNGKKPKTGRWQSRPPWTKKSPK